MLQETSKDFEEWELHPPQREEYRTPRDYAIGMKQYADRVIKYNRANGGK